MERVLSHKLFQYLNKHNVVHAAQLSFVEGRSTCSSLLCRLMMDEGHFSFLKHDIGRMERVQRCFTKLLLGFKHYSDRLVQLNLLSLQLRRIYIYIHADLLTCKLIFGHVECKLNDSSLLTRQQ